MKQPIKVYEHLKAMKNLLCAILLLTLTACGDLPDWDGGFPMPSPTPTGTPPASPEPSPEPLPVLNPICEGEQRFGRDNNVWKPKSDATSSIPNSLVAILSERWVEPFVCIATLKNGAVEVLKFTGFANGDRQHHRGVLPGGRYTGDVLCTDSQQDCLFVHGGKTSERRG